MEQLNLKYKRPDVQGGYLTDKTEIEYYKTVQFNDVIDNTMLGDYDKDGNYVIKKEVTKELVTLLKVYTEAFDKNIFCESVKKFDGQTFKFCLKLASNTPVDGKITATLTLLEDVERVNGYYKNINSAEVMSQIFDDDKDVTEKIYKFFNIKQAVSGDNGDEKVETDFDYPNIIKRLEYFKNLNKYYQSVSARNQKDLYEKRVKLLLKHKESNTVLEEFNKQAFHLKGKFLDKNSLHYYKHLNQLLDGILDVYGYTLKGNNKLTAGLARLQEEYASKHSKNTLVLDHHVQDNKKQYNAEVINNDLPKLEDVKKPIKTVEKQESLKPETKNHKVAPEPIKKDTKIEGATETPVKSGGIKSALGDLKVVNNEENDKKASLKDSKDTLNDIRKDASETKSSKLGKTKSALMEELSKEREKEETNIL